MALEIESVNPPSAIHLNDGDEKSMMALDLEDGEIEDGEIPDEVGGINQAVIDKKTFSAPDINAAVKETEVKIKPSLFMPKVKKTGSIVNNRNSDIGKENIVEDDWASDVEKAIKAAMSVKVKAPELKSVSSITDAKCQDGNEEDDERKSRRKKRKKKHRDDDEERKESKKRKRNHGISRETSENGLEMSQLQGSDQDIDEDDDEMLFIRGASPIMKMGYNSPNHLFKDERYGYDEGGHCEEPYDSLCDESDFEREGFTRPHRGDENGSKRGGRGVKRRLLGRGGGRGVSNKRLLGNHNDTLVNKAKRIGIKRQQQQQRSSIAMQESRQGPDSICMFFMQGKCQKGDDCPYSHDAHPPRKMELCKFYLMDCCAKKDKCLYMHSDFPCKFYHTGLKCFAGDRCKFNHGILTETLRGILLKHLETAPKEILGDFPRLSREGAAAMVYSKKNRGNKGNGSGNKKIPSLFEIEVPIPAQLLSGNHHADEERSPARRSTPMPDSENEDQDACSTPMPSPPKMETLNTSNRSTNRQWDSENAVRAGNVCNDVEPHSGIPRAHRSTDSNREHNEERDKSKRSSPEYQNQDFSQQLEQLKIKFYQETLNNAEEGGANSEARHRRHRHHHHHHHSKNKTMGDEEERKNKANIHRQAGYSPSHTVDSDEGGGSSKQNCKLRSGEAPQYLDEERNFEVDDQISEFKVDAMRRCNATEAASSSQEIMKKEQFETDNNSSCSVDVGRLPHTLPKKQRELFLRIQQQQREAVDSSSQDQSGEDDGKDVVTDQVQQEENWYSSDEEEASLTDVLKNLSKQQQEQPSKQEPRASTPPPLPQLAATPSLDSIKLAEIDISESVSKLLSSIRNQQNAKLTNMPLIEETSDSRTSSQSTVAVVPVPSQARDPRLVSRDPRNRRSSTSSTSVVSTRSYESPRHDPRTSRRSSSSDERNEIDHTSIYSSAITASPSNATQRHADSADDVDLRRFPAKQGQVNSGFETGGDMDLRQNMVMSSSYIYGDTDLRADVDLRAMLGLPFKPVPMHTPATEIEASLTSHPPITYKVVTITIPRPDYSGLKLNMSDPQVRNDPRLRKLFKISSSSDSPASPPPPPPPPKRSPSSLLRSDPRRRSAPVTTSSATSLRVQETTPVYSETVSQNPNINLSVMHSQSILPGMVLTMPTGISFDPRIPRNPRNAPGLLGPAPMLHNFCPSTPRYEDMEEGNSNGSDTDFRMFYNQPSMDLQPQHSQNQQHAQNRSWQRHNQQYQSQYEQQRSFTPPL